MNVLRTRRAPTAAHPLALLLFVVAVAPSTARAQSAAEKEVVSVVERFFAGMLARDSALMSSTVAPGARLVRVARPQGGEPVVNTTDMSQFIAGAARRQGEDANERIYNPEVRIDGNMATVWTFYTLHLGERLNHCGFDAFQLLRLSDGWKIVNVADTSRTEGCEAPGR